MAKQPSKKPAPKSAKANPKSQRERFIEAAREHGTDETGETFERMFRAIVPPKAAKPRSE